LLVARIVAGAGAGLYAPTAATTAAALVPPAQRARALALSLGGLITATVLGVPIGTALGTHVGWRATMILVVALGAAGGLLPFYLMLWGAAGVAGNLTVAQLIDRGRRPLVVLIAVLVFPVLGMLGLHFAGPVTVLFTLIGYGIGGGSAQVPLQHRLFEVAGDRGPVAVSLLSGGLYLGAAVGAALGAVAFRDFGATWLGPLAAVPAAGALLMAVILARRQARQAHREPAGAPAAAVPAADPATGCGENGSCPSSPVGDVAR
jgi:predicted MFS family arabinose efflux permease